MSTTPASTAERFTRFAIPLALVVFVLVAIGAFRGLPEQVPIRFGAAADEARWMSAKNFIALQIGLTGGLGTLLLVARWALTLPGYDADGRFRTYPALLPRTLVTLDLTGAGGILLIAWTGYLCAAASRSPDPSLSRMALLGPLALLLLGGLAGWRWIRAAQRPH